MTKAQCAELCNDLPNLKQSIVSLVRTTYKMKTGLSNKLLSVKFNLKKSQVQPAITSSRMSLMNCSVRKHLRLGHITHTEFCQNHTTVAGSLFKSSQGADEAILILNGTYVNLQRSMDYLFRRKYYSMHKNRTLAKSMMVVGSDGYILSIFGPYYAKAK